MQQRPAPGFTGAGMRANVRFMFQAMVTKYALWAFSPRT